MQIFVTGGSGFLGGHICELFRQRGHDVAALVRPSSATGVLKSAGVKLREGTLEDPESLRRAMQGADVVIHSAAKVHAQGRWEDFVLSTIEGTRNVLEAAIAVGVPHFIQISSAGVYGTPRPDGIPFDETHPPNPPFRWNYYSRAKIVAEQLIQDAQRNKKISTTILRPTWIYGPRDFTTLSRFVAALSQRRLVWIGPGDNRLSFVHVSDVASAVLLAATAQNDRGQIYNIADDEHCMTQKEFITQLCEAVGVPLPSRTLSYRQAHLLGFAGECIAHLSGFRCCPPLSRLSALLIGGKRGYRADKIRNELGWKPSRTMAEGMKGTISWYLQKGRDGREE